MYLNQIREQNLIKYRAGFTFVTCFVIIFHRWMLIGLLYEMLRSARSPDSKAWKVCLQSLKWIFYHVYIFSSHF